jgi:poly-gamma-glutamate synthesis protein (capsule biosynthesis protein)
MANSYSINRGLSGLASSIDAVRTAGMEPLGVYATNDDFKAGKGYTIRVVDGIKLAFVAFTKGMDGMALPEGSENCVNILYTDYDSVYQDVDTAKITSILDAVAKENPDLVVALLHWGSEFNNTISASQEKITQLLQSRGVDAIIGTHSHYVQKMVLNEETGQFIAYSLGDFFSDCKKSGSEYSIVLDLEITKDNLTGETKITDYSYTPIFTVHEPGTPLRVVRLQEAIAAYESNFINKISEDTYNKMTYARSRIEARTAGE